MIHKPTTGELGGLSDNFVLNKMPFHATQDINVYFMQHLISMICMTCWMILNSFFATIRLWFRI